ncbi:hypothetical protein [Streptomyces sp. Tu102]|uniref:hypothetical protein n=1 Tax=Streptomyces TaxID=1883 RepID=UPI001BDCEE2A|nr:hypothetical protein [Streptomyces sp. Tu102]MBT1094200.1 hypothetical protein [Streptomyces sp. Tu102]
MPRRTVVLPGEDELPAGPLRELTVGVYELYVAAGCPSLRGISTSITASMDAPTTVSHERIRQVLTGKGESASCSVIVAIVLALSGMARPARDADAEAERFSRLWRVVAGLEPLRPDLEVRSGPASLPRTDEQAVLDVRQFAGRSPQAIARHLCQVGAGEGVEAFLTGLVRLSDAVMIIHLVEQLRMAGLHETAERLIDLSAQNLPLPSLGELVWRFFKEQWRVQALLTAIARSRTPSEVYELWWQLADRRRPEAEALKDLFRQLRGDDDNAELEQLLAEADAGLEGGSPAE